MDLLYSHDDGVKFAGRSKIAVHGNRKRRFFSAERSFVRYDPPLSATYSSLLHLDRRFLARKSDPRRHHRRPCVYRGYFYWRRANPRARERARVFLLRRVKDTLAHTLRRAARGLLTCSKLSVY